MKIELTVYLLDFLSERGYQYLLLQQNSKGSPSATEKYDFIPVRNFENISHYYSGSSSCFYLEAEPRLMAEGIAGKAFYVLLDSREVLDFRSYLSQVAVGDRAYSS